MSKLFSNLLNKDKDLSSSKNFPVKNSGEKSTPMIIFGLLISLISIFLLLFTINYKFG